MGTPTRTVRALTRAASVSNGFRRAGLASRTSQGSRFLGPGEMRQRRRRSVQVRDGRMSRSPAGEIGNAIVRPLLSSRSLFGWLDGVSSVFLLVGLFTLSWERLGNIPLGPYNVKLPVIAFGLSFVCALASGRRPWTAPSRRSPSWLVLLLVTAIVLVYVTRSLFVIDRGAAVAQVVALITGAVIPAAAVAFKCRSLTDLAWQCTWIVRGAVLACVFGLYQLLAYYTGLPQGVDYNGVVVGGTIGRIAAFNYEPAYFMYFLVMAVGALLTRALIIRSMPSWYVMALFSLCFAFSGVRALLFLLPVTALMLLMSWRLNRRTVLKLAAFIVVAGIVAMGVNGLIRSAKSEGGVNGVTAASAPSRESSSSSRSDSEAQTPQPANSAPSPGTNSAADEPSGPSSVFDPTEQTSNAPRLNLYRSVAAVALQHPILGVGPGQLGVALGQPSARIVANDIWLQAGADGGIVLLVLEGAVIVIVVIIGLRRWLSVLQPLIVTWVTVIGVAGMLTSIFFDLKVWVVLALIISAARLLDSEASDPQNWKGQVSSN